MNDGVVVVTGARGFIGAHVVPLLAHAGWRVRELTRSTSRSPFARVETFRIDGLQDRDGLRAALAGATAVVHLAALAHRLDEPAASGADDYERVNVAGTELLLREVVAAGVRTFLFMSSAAAVASTAAEPLDDAAMPDPDTPYGRSKLRAERLVREVAAAAGLRSPVLRPPMIYGPGMKGNPLRLWRAVARGVPLPFGAIRNRRSIMFVGNLAAAVRQSLARPADADDVFLVTDGTAVSSLELARDVGRSLGRPARVLPLPPSLLRAAAHAAALMPGRRDFSAAVDRLTGSLVLDDARFRERTGFAPAVGYAAGLAETSRWFTSASKQ